MKPAKNTICLWYDRDAVEAAKFYAEDFPRFHRGREFIARRATTHRTKKAMY
jgi:predicted 3-demethylubiquinone-9 3-methyltransferase (glyoxalase superfamily)